MSRADAGGETEMRPSSKQCKIMSVLAQHDFMRSVREQIIANRKELAEQERLLDEIADHAPLEVRILKKQLAIAKQHQTRIETMFGQANCNVVELKHYRKRRGRS
jgi:hypothetical protein